MSQSNFTLKRDANQLILPGFAPVLPGYPIRGIMHVMALSVIYGWSRLYRLAARQLAREGRGRP
jgi:hypothetical protein